MNDLILRFESCEKEGTKDIQSLLADVCFNRDKIDESENDADLNIWVSWPNEYGKWEKKPELPSFNGKTAIALRDFLIFCFPLDKYK